MALDAGAELWRECRGEQAIAPLRGKLVRLVESQEQVATLQLVDTLEEQALLEELIETSKPHLPPSSETLHYLLKTPFRYPPLRWGSRFGRRRNAPRHCNRAARPYIGRATSRRSMVPGALRPLFPSFAALGTSGPAVGSSTEGKTICPSAP